MNENNICFSSGLKVADSAEPPNFLRFPSPKIPAVIPTIPDPSRWRVPPSLVHKRGMDSPPIPNSRTLPSAIHFHNSGDFSLPNFRILPEPTHAFVAFACASPITLVNPNLLLYSCKIVPRSCIVTAPSSVINPSSIVFV